MGRVFLGALLLGGVTSLPEGAVTVSAAALEDASLAVSNLFGGVALQVAILAVIDGIARGRPLSSRIDEAGVILYGVLQVLVLLIAMAAILIGDVLFLGIGVGSTLVATSAIGAFYLSYRTSSRNRWEPVTRFAEGGSATSTPANPAHDLSQTRLIGLSVFAGMVVIAGGIALAWSGEAIATQTGLGSGFVGAVFLAAATSLPEITTTWAAVTLGRFGMAFASIFGTNILDLSFVLLADAAFTGEAVLTQVGETALLAALLGTVLTVMYLAGILVRPKRLVLWMGWDSLAVLVLYACGVLTLYLVG